ncbi:MAG: MAPEG family protein [Pseudomonadales bacterium]|nr:MAPEG family protein [Pseudomonadales bacterium]
MTDLLGDLNPILLPVFVLVIWTIIMLCWMAATRLPYIAKQNWGPETGERTSELAAKMPKEIQWKADNYNHLLEQPTAFYATAIASAMIGLGDGLNLYLAWAYVISRIVHSVVHATVNVVMVRFMIFLVGTICLLVMAGNGAMHMMTG